MSYARDLGSSLRTSSARYCSGVVSHAGAPVKSGSDRSFKQPRQFTACSVTGAASKSTKTTGRRPFLGWRRSVVRVERFARRLNEPPMARKLSSAVVLNFIPLSARPVRRCRVLLKQQRTSPPAGN